MLLRGSYWLLHGFGLLSLLASHLVWSLPWDAVNGRSALGNMIAGAAPVEGIGPLRVNQVPHKRHIGVRDSNAAVGNLTILIHQENPPLFIINRRQLYYYVNETTIFPVNVHNTTLPERPHLQLMVGKKREGITGGSWRWAGSMLYYDFPGDVGSQGLFWSCATEEGWLSNAIFMFNYMEDGPLRDCNSITFHTFGNS